MDCVGANRVQGPALEDSLGPGVPLWNDPVCCSGAEDRNSFFSCSLERFLLRKDHSRAGAPETSLSFQQLLSSLQD